MPIDLNIIPIVWRFLLHQTWHPKSGFATLPPWSENRATYVHACNVRVLALHPDLNNSGFQGAFHQKMGQGTSDWSDFTYGGGFWFRQNVTGFSRISLNSGKSHLIQVNLTGFGWISTMFLFWCKFCHLILLLYRMVWSTSNYHIYGPPTSMLFGCCYLRYCKHCDCSWMDLTFKRVDGTVPMFQR